MQVPDSRLDPLAKSAGTTTIIPAAIEMVDIAGLVEGASKGEGLGNKFLANVREVDAIVHVVRCFEDEDVIHNMGRVDPIRDAEVIMTELVLADAESVASQLQKNLKKARGNDKDAEANAALLERLVPHLDEGKPANLLEMDEDERTRLKAFFLLSGKPMLYACNLKEEEIADPGTNPLSNPSKSGQTVNRMPIAAAFRPRWKKSCRNCRTRTQRNTWKPWESKIPGNFLDRGQLRTTWLGQFSDRRGKRSPGLDLPQGNDRPQRAGVIHTDFEKAFIKAEVVSYEDLIAAGSMQKARDAGNLRLEGKEYVFVDGDVVPFKCNA